MLGAEPSQQFQTALKNLLSLLSYNVLLTLETAQLAFPAAGGDPNTVYVQIILFKVYEKICPVSAPCSHQRGVLLRNLEVFTVDLVRVWANALTCISPRTRPST